MKLCLFVDLKKKQLLNPAHTLITNAAKTNSMQQLTVVQLAKKPAAFMVPEGSMPCPQGSATGP
jgi:hypothetical protein